MFNKLKNKTKFLPIIIVVIATIIIPLSMQSNTTVDLPKTERSEIFVEAVELVEKQEEVETIESSQTTTPTSLQEEAKEEKVSSPVVAKVEAPKVAGMDKIKAFLAKRKNAYTDQYLNTLYQACGNDMHSLRLIVAISGHETSFGTKGSPIQGYKWNFWGWGYNSKKKTYMNGTQEQMANAMCVGFRKGGRYYSMISNGIVRADLAKLYSGNDRTDTWSRNVLHFYNSML